MDKKITRSFDFAMRAENNEKHGNHVEGLAIAFDQATDLRWFSEIIDRGALDGADLKDVRFLVNHNTDMIPLARSRNNNENSTMQMSVTDEGLRVRVDLDTEHNTDAQNLYSAISRGDVSGMSFMFTVDGESWDNLESDYPTRHITKIGQVYEVSAVTFPAYEQTSIQARDDAEALESARSILESRRAEEEAKAQADTEARARDEYVNKLLLKLESKEG